MYKLMMSIFYFGCFFFSSFFSFGSSTEVDLTNPYTMVQQVADNTFSRIKNEREKIKTNPLIVNNIVEHELMPYIDYRFSALKILGKYYKQYPLDRINQYTEVFKAYSASVFANALNYYQDQSVEFEPAQSFENSKQVSVRLNIQDMKKSINISFIVRKNKQTGQWRVYDIVAEGISMLSSLKSQFDPILRKEGLDAVIKVMTKSDS